MDDEILKAKLQHAHEASQKDPVDDKNMYESYYEARKELTALKGDLLQMYTEAGEDDAKKKVLQAQLAKVHLTIGKNMIHCKETAEGKEMLDVSQSLLEAGRIGKMYDFEAAACRKAAKAKEAKEKAEQIAKLKEDAKKKGVNMDTKASASWLPETQAGLEAVIEEFPIPTTFENVCYDYVDMLVDVYNNLAMQWCNWHEDLKAEKLLLNAQKIYEDWAQHSPIKKLETLEEGSPAEKSAGVSLQSVMDDFKSESQACHDLRNQERQKQNDLLQQKLAKKRMKKGIIASPVESPDTEESTDTDTVQSDAQAAAQAEVQLKRLERHVQHLEERGQTLKQKKELEGQITEAGRAMAQNMDAQFALTMYALGQVYSKLEKPHQAASCYLKVLNRQLKMKDIDRTSWIQNAANLALYYIAEYELPQAEHCLNAADLFMPREPSDADKDLCCTLDLIWAKYYHRLMKLNRDVAVEMEKDSSFKGGKEDPYSLQACDRVVLKEKPHVPKARFERLPIGPPRDEIILVSNLPQARALFQLSLDRYSKVVDYYNIDEWTEERIYMMQEISGLYEMMTTFESDLDTKWTLHSKRVPYLEDFLDKLENIIFTNTLRQYRFELGNVHQAMADIRLEQMRAGISQATKEDINAILRKGCDYFEKFVESFKWEWDEIQKLKPAEERSKDFVLEEDYLLAYILGKCSVASMQMKIITADKADQDKNIETALGLYQYCIDFAKKCKLDKKEDVKEHLKLCKQMVQLLPDAKSTGKYPQLPSNQRPSKTSALLQKTSTSSRKAPARK